MNARLLLAAFLLLCASSASRADPWTWPAQVTGSEPLRNLYLLDRYGVQLLEPKIVGGEKARLGDDPWQVALIGGDNFGPDRRPFCGGVLVADTWVLTAAHCVDDNTRPSQISVLVGATDVGPDGGAKRVEVSRIILHPLYLSGKPPRHDLALLQLASSAAGRFTAAIATLPLEDEAKALAGQATARVTGWGVLGAGDEYGVRQLRFVDLKIVSNRTCNDRVAYKGRITDYMFCAGFADRLEPKDSCQGDSGGPLTVRLAGKRYLAGIVSWGDGCAIQERPGVYTRVPRYSAWVADCQQGKASCTSPTFSVIEHAGEERTVSFSEQQGAGQ
ncbi:S1 family serine peptidase [Pseudomonas sp. Tul1A2]